MLLNHFYLYLSIESNWQCILKELQRKGTFSSIILLFFNPQNYTTYDDTKNAFNWHLLVSAGLCSLFGLGLTYFSPVFGWLFFFPTRSRTQNVGKQAYVPAVTYEALAFGKHQNFFLNNLLNPTERKQIYTPISRRLSSRLHIVGFLTTTEYFSEIKSTILNY